MNERDASAGAAPAGPTTSLDAAIAAHYAEFNPDKYIVDRQRALVQGRKRLHSVRGLLPQAREARVREVGCGNGGFLAALREAGYRDLAGCDLCQPLADYCAKELQLEVVHEDVISYVRQIAEPVDCICAFDLIEHLDRDTLFVFLSEVHRVLKPGGVLVGATPNGACPRAFYAMISDLTHRQVLAPRSLEFIAELAGFESTATFPKYLSAPLPGLVDRVVKGLAYPLLAAAHFAYFFEWPRLVTANMIFVLRKGGGEDA